MFLFSIHDPLVKRFRKYLSLHGKLNLTLETLDNLMATITEQTARLNKVLTQQKKTSDEIRALQSSSDLNLVKIAELQAVIAGMGDNAPADLVAAVDAVEAQSQTVDDQIPDAPGPAPEPAPAPEPEPTP